MSPTKTGAKNVDEDSSHINDYSEARRFGSTVNNKKSNADLDPRVDIADPLYYDDDEFSFAPLKPVYHIPHWVDISFWNRPASSSGEMNSNFVLRAKMYELQMMGGTEALGSTIMVKRLDWNAATETEDGSDSIPQEQKRISLDDHAALYELYDDRIFMGEFGRPFRTMSMSMSANDSVPRKPGSPDIGPIRGVIPAASLTTTFPAYKVTDTVRSLDADLLYKHQNNSSEDLDTLTRSQGEALLARIRGGTGSVRQSKSSTQLTSLFSPTSPSSEEYSKVSKKLLA